MTDITIMLDNKRNSNTFRGKTLSYLPFISTRTMKVAFHFNCNDIASRYDEPFYELLFGSLLQVMPLHISSKIFIGDLLSSKAHRSGMKKDQFLAQLIRKDLWVKMIPGKDMELIEKNTFVICFETIQKDLAEKIHFAVKASPKYLGAFEIDNAKPLHWILYGESLMYLFRIIDRNLYIQNNNMDDENKEVIEGYVSYFNKFRFDKIIVENAFLKYSLFDEKHNYENAKRTAEWKNSMEALFSTVTDEIVSKLMDAAPDLNDKLWAMMDAYNNATTGEQYAHAMFSCRRVFQYVVDCLFPPTDEVIDGHELHTDKHKNRLYEFTKRELTSETNVKLVLTNISALYDEWSKLYDLSNKGVHDEPHRQECRRCILRTVLLLDDLVAIKNGPFDTNVKMGKFISQLAEKYK